MTDNSAPQSPPTCSRHPDRVSYLRCQRCGQPTCPECQHPAPVGFHCTDCLAASRQAAPRTVGGGRPVVTYTLAGICAVVYLCQRLVPGVTTWGDFSPLLGYVQPWRFLTSAFLHSPDTLTHLLFNLMGLYIMGQFIEPLVGRARFTALYLLSALGGAVGYLLLVPIPSVASLGWGPTMVGASGAVFGLFGAAFLVLRRLGDSVRGMVILLAINLALPFIYPGIAWQAHVGGAVVGLATTAVILATIRPARRRWTWPALAGVLFLLVVVAVARYAVIGLIPL